MGMESQGRLFQTALFTFHVQSRPSTSLMALDTFDLIHFFHTDEIKRNGNLG